MALNVQVGTITQPGSTGNQTTNLPADFDPKALILWGTPQTGDANLTADASFCMGMATARGGGAQAGYCTYFSDNAQGTSIVAHGIDDTHVYKLFSDGTTPTVDCSVTFVSFGSGASSNFVLNWTNLHSTASILVNYMVLGGSDITDAFVDLYNLAAGATQDITVTTGFGQPDLLFFMSAGATSGTGGDTAASAALGLSVAKSATERFAVVFNDEDNAGTMLCAAWAKQRALTQVVPTTQLADCEAELSAKASWPTDGFQLTYSDQTASTAPVIVLALKGTFTSKVGYVDSGTATASVDFDHGATPQGALWFAAMGAGTAETINGSSTYLGSFSLGAYDGATEVYAAAGNDDGALSSSTRIARSATKAMILRSPSSTTEADGSWSGTNARLTWTGSPPENTRIGVLTLSDSATTNATVSPPAATVSIAAPTPTPALSILTPLATISVAAAEPTPAITIPIPVGTITVDGLAPVIDTGGTNATVSPDPATVAVAALVPNPALTVEPPLGTISVAGVAPTPTLAVAPDPATVTVAAFAPTPAITLLPAQATVSVAGVVPTPSITVFPDQATVSTAALAPTPQITLLPGAATVSVAGVAPTPQITIQPGAATLLVAAFAPTLEGSAAFGLGTVVCDDLSLAAVACDSLSLTADTSGTLTLTAASSDALSLAAPGNDSLSLTAV